MMAIVRRWSGAALVLWLAAATAWAQPAPTPLAPVAASMPVGSAEVPVVVAQRVVAIFRSPYLGVSPERRAQRTEAILRELLDRAERGEVTVQVEPLRCLAHVCAPTTVHVAVVEPLVAVQMYSLALVVSMSRPPRAT